MRIPLSQSLKIIFLLIPALGLAHGEMKPGPHGGEVQMPGAFHVEVITKKGVVGVYLLDMQFGNPQVTDSSVEVMLEQTGNQSVLECHVANTEKMFRCFPPNEEKLDSGKLIINATRGSRPGAPMSYDLPLKWSDKSPVTE